MDPSSLRHLRNSSPNHSRPYHHTFRIDFPIVLQRACLFQGSLRNGRLEARRVKRVRIRVIRSSPIYHCLLHPHLSSKPNLSRLCPLSHKHLTSLRRIGARKQSRAKVPARIRANPQVAFRRRRAVFRSNWRRRCKVKAQEAIA